MNGTLLKDLRNWLLLCMLLLLSVLTACGEKKEAGIDDFLRKHWADPVLPQGNAPDGFSFLESSLSAGACGTCHKDQFESWRSSLHSHAVGDGLLWQFDLLDQAQANRCMRCHAPLAEQKALLAMEQGWAAVPATPPPDFIAPTLGHEGVTCAACHLRGHVRFGPAPIQPLAGERAHAGFVTSPAFEDSRFCAFCHQFPESGPRLAGKLQEDTYEQWKASPYNPKTSCQSCHMPDRKHQWRGIHDPEMTRKAIDVALEIRRDEAGGYYASAKVSNVGAGHHFPTYMVPKVVLNYNLVEGKRKPRRLDIRGIGWIVDTQITREIADTRIPAGASKEFSVPFSPPPGKDWRIELVVEVQPDEHYERLFADSLKSQTGLSPRAAVALRNAWLKARSTRYELMQVTAHP